MGVLLPTTTPKYLYYSPMVLSQDMMEAPVDRNLHLSRPSYPKDLIHGQRDCLEVAILYNLWGKSYINSMGHP